MTKTVKIILLAVVFLIAGIAIAGMIRFNILQDDIYFVQKDGSTVRVIDLDEYVLETEDGVLGIFSYTSKDKNSASLDIDGKFYQLKKASSDTGVKYVSEDEGLVFSDIDGNITLKINGATVHEVSSLRP